METQDFRNQLQQAILRSDIVKIFDNLLTIAVEEWASDIHIEPMENYSRIRLRIDGVLVELIQYPRSLHESIISKFKNESGQMKKDSLKMREFPVSHKPIKKLISVRTLFQRFGEKNS